MTTLLTREQVVFAHNPDFSGDVTIVVDPAKVRHYEFGGETRGALEISFEDLRALYLKYLREQVLKNLGDMSDAELEKFAARVYGGTRARK